MEGRVRPGRPVGRRRCAASSARRSTPTPARRGGGFETRAARGAGDKKRRARNIRPPSRADVILKALRHSSSNFSLYPAFRRDRGLGAFAKENGLFRVYDLGGAGRSRDPCRFVCDLFHVAMGSHSSGACRRLSRLPGRADRPAVSRAISVAAALSLARDKRRLAGVRRRPPSSCGPRPGTFRLGWR